MSYFILQITLAIIIFCLILFGVLYAFIVRYHPARRTWTEVVFGVGGTLIFLFVAQYFIFYYYGVVDILGWTLCLPVLFFALSGISQIIFQEKKHREEKRNATHTKQEFKEV